MQDQQTDLKINRDHPLSIDTKLEFYQDKVSKDIERTITLYVSLQTHKQVQITPPWKTCYRVWVCNATKNISTKK